MVETIIPKIAPDEVIDFMNIDSTDFGSFTLAQRICHFEVEGYVMLCDVLDTKHIAKLKQELANASMSPKPYSEYQTTSDKQPPIIQINNSLRSGSGIPQPDARQRQFP